MGNDEISFGIVLVYMGSESKMLTMSRYIMTPKLSPTYFPIWYIIFVYPCFLNMFTKSSVSVVFIRL